MVRLWYVYSLCTKSNAASIGLVGESNNRMMLPLNIGKPKDLNQPLNFAVKDAHRSCNRDLCISLLIMHSRRDSNAV